MGIRGLSHYIANCCPGVFKRNVKLHDTRLIIDGNNFFRTFPLSLRGNVDAFVGYGVNYDTFYTALQTFIYKLRRCNIEPVFIFVGTTSCQEFIFERVKLRNQQHIDLLCKFISDKYSTRKHDLPRGLLAKSLLVRFLNDHSIHHLTMDLEEDDEIVALANRWNCPIMTGDSDFYCFQYTGSARVLPAWRFDFDVSQNKNGYFIQTAQSFYTRDLAKFHDIDDPRFISLFAAIMVEKDISENFLDIVPLQPIERDKELNVLLRLIRQASKQTMLEEVLEDLSEYFNDIDEDLHDSIRERTHQLMVKDAKIEYYSYLEDSCEVVCTSTILTKSGKRLPEWFIDAFRGADVSRYFVGILARRATSLYTQLEDPEQSSPNEATTDIRAVMWGILIKYDDKVDPLVTEFYRERVEVRERTLIPVFDVKGYGTVPDLDHIPELPEAKRREFLFKVLELENDLRTFPENYHMFIVVCRYWIRKTNPADHFIQAMLLCFIKLGIISFALESIVDIENLTLNDDGSRGNKNQLGICSQDWKDANVKLQQNRLLNKFAVKNTPERIRTHHVFAQWLTIYSEIYRLNKLLRYPVVEIGPEHCFRGTFVFCYQHCFKLKSDAANDIITDLLGESIYDKVYVPLWKTLNNTGN